MTRAQHTCTRPITCPPPHLASPVLLHTRHHLSSWHHLPSLLHLSSWTPGTTCPPEGGQRWRGQERGCPSRHPAWRSSPPSGGGSSSAGGWRARAGPSRASPSPTSKPPSTPSRSDIWFVKIKLCGYKNSSFPRDCWACYGAIVLPFLTIDNGWTS